MGLMNYQGHAAELHDDRFKDEYLNLQVGSDPCHSPLRYWLTSRFFIMVLTELNCTV